MFLNIRAARQEPLNLSLKLMQMWRPASFICQATRNGHSDTSAWSAPKDLFFFVCKATTIKRSDTSAWEIGTLRLSSNDQAFGFISVRHCSSWLKNWNSRTCRRDIVNFTLSGVRTLQIGWIRILVHLKKPSEPNIVPHRKNMKVWAKVPVPMTLLLQPGTPILESLLHWHGLFHALNACTGDSIDSIHQELGHASAWNLLCGKSMQRSFKHYNLRETLQHTR